MPLFEGDLLKKHEELNNKFSITTTLLLCIRLVIFVSVSGSCLSHLSYWRLLERLLIVSRDLFLVDGIDCVLQNVGGA